MQAEEEFGCEWECQVSHKDFGHANYMVGLSSLTGMLSIQWVRFQVGNKYCKASASEKFGICYRNN